MTRYKAGACREVGQIGLGTQECFRVQVLLHGKLGDFMRLLQLEDDSMTFQDQDRKKKPVGLLGFCTFYNIDFNSF